MDLLLLEVTVFIPLPGATRAHTARLSHCHFLS